MKVDGQCHCGAIAYEAEVQEVSITICHCTDCQTHSGSAFRANIFAPATSFLYKLAPRISERETMRMNSFREVRGQWWWFVVGKGHKKAKLPVPDDMMEALVRYRKHRELSAATSPKDDSPCSFSSRM